MSVVAQHNKQILTRAAFCGGHPSTEQFLKPGWRCCLTRAVAGPTSWSQPTHPPTALPRDRNDDTVPFCPPASTSTSATGSGTVLLPVSRCQAATQQAVQSAGPTVLVPTVGPV